MTSSLFEKENAESDNVITLHDNSACSYNRERNLSIEAIFVKL